MQRTIAYCLAGLALLGLTPSRADADLMDASANGAYGTFPATLAFSSAYGQDDVGDAGFGAILSDADMWRTGETIDPDRTLRAGHEVGLLLPGAGVVTGDPDPADPRLSRELAPQTADGAPGEELNTWASVASSGTGLFEATVPPDPTAVGDVHVLNIEWVDATPARSDVVLVPAPGAFLLGALGFGLAGLVARRFR